MPSSNEEEIVNLFGPNSALRKLFQEVADVSKDPRVAELIRRMGERVEKMVSDHDAVVNARIAEVSKAKGLSELQTEVMEELVTKFIGAMEASFQSITSQPVIGAMIAKWPEQSRIDIMLGALDVTITSVSEVVRQRHVIDDIQLEIKTLAATRKAERDAKKANEPVQ